MRLIVTIVLVFALALLIAGTANAQNNKKYEINIGGGFTPTTGDIEEHFGNGGQFEAGFTYFPKDKIGIQAQYAYTKLNGKDFTLPVSVTPGGGTLNQPFSSGMHMNGLSGDVVYRHSAPGLYLVGGGGIYKRTVNLSTPSVGFVSVCDPFWLICYPSAVSTDNVIGDRSSTDFGLNAGGGYSFKVSDSAKLYVEARYLYVFGPDIFNPVTGQKLASNANGQFLPISFGIRW
jgi:opacity protein-like surface antigen